MVNNTVDLTSKNVVNSIIEASTKNVPTIPGPYRGNYGLHGSTLSEIPPNEQFHVRNLAFGGIIEFLKVHLYSINCS